MGLNGAANIGSAIQPGVIRVPASDVTIAARKDDVGDTTAAMVRKTTTGNDVGLTADIIKRLGELPKSVGGGLDMSG